jgi:hypothetical protein
MARILDPDRPAVPRLQVWRDAQGVQLRWPALPAEFVLQSADTLSGAAWTPFPAVIALDGGSHVVNISPEGRTRFFRLETE